VENYTLFLATKSPHYDENCDFYRFLEGLRKAGVPEGPQQPELPVTGANCVIAPAR
jgi:hypothetical protein